MPDVGDLVEVILACVIIYFFLLYDRFAFCCFDLDLSLCHYSSR